MYCRNFEPPGGVNPAQPSSEVEHEQLTYRVINSVSIDEVGQQVTDPQGQDVPEQARNQTPEGEREKQTPDIITHSFCCRDNAVEGSNLREESQNAVFSVDRDDGVPQPTEDRRGYFKLTFRCSSHRG